MKEERSQVTPSWGNDKWSDPDRGSSTSGQLNAAACSGLVEISYHEIATTGGCCAGMQSVILGIAASKGCPIDGIVAPKYHPDYDYRVTHHAEGCMTIEWKIRSQKTPKCRTTRSGVVTTDLFAIYEL